jgi:PKD repeat protein
MDSKTKKTNIMKTLKFISSALVLGLVLLFSGCADDDDFKVAPTSEDAAFTFTIDPENPNRVIFKATVSDDNWYTHWDFGDNSSAEGYEASKIFFDSGDYNVRFKVFTEGGVAESIQTIVINEDLQAPNLIENGEFDGSDPWVVLPISDGVDVSFENNNAQWTGGSFGQVGIYQPIQVLANNEYQISMNIKGGPLTDSWFEVYVGMETPVPGQDYADGGMRLALNTWDGCGAEPFDGDFAEYSCVGTGATFEFTTAGTAYLVIRGGGSDYGAEGVTIDNVNIRSLGSFELAVVAGFTFETSNLTSTFTNTSANATDYSWDFGDGSGTSTDQNPNYTYAAGGTYAVTLTASSGAQATDSTQDITVVESGADPVSGYTVETSNLTATFTNTSANATSYSWDFGDGSATSTDEDPVYTYAAEGTYTVTLTATNDASVSDEFTSDVTVEEAVVTNLITNGSFDNESGWTIINIDPTDSGQASVAIADGVAKFSETVSPTDPWKHWAIYTEVSLEPGTYKFDMNMTYVDINDVWGEVYIGATQPVENTGDYNGDQQVMRAYNAWDCPDLKTYSGSAVAGGCDPNANPGQFEITSAGTYYLLFRTGGAQWGPEGIVLDNWSLLQL